MKIHHGININKGIAVGLIAVCGGSFLALVVYKILNSKGVSLGFIPAVLIWFGCYWLIKTVAKQFAKTP